MRRKGTSRTTADLVDGHNQFVHSSDYTASVIKSGKTEKKTCTIRRVRR